jgi:predicted MPP superfamily phosphohydrolase
MFHALMAWGALGVFRLFNRRFGWFKIAPEAREQWRHRCCAGIVCAALLVCLGGAINMQFPVVREVKLPAPAGAGPLRIVALSDLHLGRLAGTRFLSGVADLIEPLKPDIVVFLGDILEYDFDPSEIEADAAVLRRLNPRLGIWGVMGNHEHIGEKGKLNMRYLNEMGIRMLADQWTVLEEVWGRHADGGKILLIGQQDRYAWQNPLEKTLANAPKDAALKLLLVHQPFNLWEAEKAGINLQLSGHTHNGQFFPLNFAAKILFENPYGHSMRGQTHYWVTSGIGTWGQRIRTSNRPEIVQIDLVP